MNHTDMEVSIAVRTPTVVMTEELDLVLDHFAGYIWLTADDMWTDVIEFCAHLHASGRITTDEAIDLHAAVLVVDEFACYEFPGEAGE